MYFVTNVGVLSNAIPRAHARGGSVRSASRSGHASARAGHLSGAQCNVQMRILILSWNLCVLSHQGTQAITQACATAGPFFHRGAHSQSQRGCAPTGPPCHGAGSRASTCEKRRPVLLVTARAHVQAPGRNNHRCGGLSTPTR